MDVLRINLAHSGAIDPAQFIADYRAACAQLNREPCVCVDLQGSELRTCWLVDQESKEPVASISLRQGQRVTLFGSENGSQEDFVGWEDGDETLLGIGCAALGTLIEKDSIIRMDDGSVAIMVEAIVSSNEVRGVVLSDCVLGGHKMVSTAGFKVRGPFLSAKDTADIAWAAEQKVNFVCAAFTRCQEDVEELQEALDACSGGSDARCDPLHITPPGSSVLHVRLTTCRGPVPIAMIVTTKGYDHKTPMHLHRCPSGCFACHAVAGSPWERPTLNEGHRVPRG